MAQDTSVAKYGSHGEQRNKFKETCCVPNGDSTIAPTRHCTYHSSTCIRRLQGPTRKLLKHQVSSRSSSCLVCPTRSPLLTARSCRCRKDCRYHPIRCTSTKRPNQRIKGDYRQVSFEVDLHSTYEQSREDHEDPISPFRW